MPNILIDFQFTMNRLRYCKVFTACCVAVLLAHASADNGSLPSHVVGGRVVNNNEAGWQVAIVHKRHFICSGSLLRKNVVLTAASCIKDLKNSDIKIRAGSKRFKSGGQNRAVLETMYHPEYKTNEYANNIAMIKLRRPFNSTVNNIQIIKMPTKETIELPSSISIYGWGLSRFNANKYITKRLRVSKYKVYSDKKCLRHLPESDKGQTEKVFCIGDRTKQVDVCNDDIGGPAISRQYETQYGVISRNGACSENKTIIVTSLEPHKSWIKEVLQGWKSANKPKIYF